MDDDRLLGNVDAFLGTFGVTEFAANAFVCYIISPCSGLDCAEGEGSPLDGGLGKVEPFSGPLIDLEHRKGAAGRKVRVNLLHIGILLKQTGQFVRADFFCLSLNGNCHAGKGVLPLHGGEGNMFVGFQTVIPFARFVK